MPASLVASSKLSSGIPILTFWIDARDTPESCAARIAETFRNFIH